MGENTNPAAGLACHDLNFIRRVVRGRSRTRTPRVIGFWLEEDMRMFTPSA
jgi:hypothetical protein